MALNQFTPAAQKALNKALSGIAAHHDVLRTWGAANMPDVGAGLVVGSIVWQTSLGRPKAQQRCNGFDIKLISWTLLSAGPSTGGPLTDQWACAEFPVTRKWDDSDGEDYLVHFMHEMPEGEQRLQVVVSRVDGGGWLTASGAPSQEHLILSPGQRSYGYKLPHAITNWIEPFRVIRALDSPSVYRDR